MKKRLGSNSAVLVSAALVAILGAPVTGSAGGLTNSPIHVRAQNSGDKNFSAIKPGLGVGRPIESPSDPSSPLPSIPPVDLPVSPASDFTWSTTSTYAMITGYTGSSKALSLPQSYSYNGLDLPVTMIGTDAFKGTSIESVVIPRSMTRISSYAFRSASSLKAVAIPNTVTSIGAYAFYGAPLESLSLPDTITSISTYAFYGAKLGSLKLPDSVTSVSFYAFYKSGITELKLPNNLSTLNIRSFANNPMTTLTIPKSVTTINDSVFDSTTTIQSIYMEGNAPTTVTAAGTNGSFGDATGKIIYYKVGATGYSNPWKGYTTATY